MNHPLVGKVVFVAILLAAFLGMRFLYLVIRGRWRERHPLGAVRCPDCGTETTCSRCPTCGQSVQADRLPWRFAGYLPFLIVVLLYLLFRRFVFPNAF